MNFEAYLGRVVTLKTTNGLEIIGLAQSYNDNVLVLDKPRVVVINSEKIGMVPYTFTADGETEFYCPLILSIMLTDNDSATDYLSILNHIGSQ
jgi:hypothetical protein